MQPKLSIVCLTYNHGKYIREALEGFVMQETGFAYEIIVHDDASTDGTADVVREYEARYPDKFRCIYQKVNQWGKKHIWRDVVFPLVRGEYVAMCEGDDYWTDPHKLQKQVDLLERSPELSMCFHAVRMKWDDGSKCDSKKLFPSAHRVQHKTVLEKEDLARGNFIPACSVVYRWRFHKDSLSLLHDYMQPGDLYLHLLHAQLGKIGYLPEDMGVYRRHSGGISYGDGSSAEWHCRNYEAQRRFCEGISQQIGLELGQMYYTNLYTTYYAAIHLQREDIRQELEATHPELRPLGVGHPFGGVIKVWLRLRALMARKGRPEAERRKALYKAYKRYLKWRKRG